MNKFRIRYRYPIVWLIVFALLFFPIAIELFCTGVTFETDKATYSVVYYGSRFWLGFWTLVFFPVAIILFIVNGAGIVKNYKDIELEAVRLHDEK